MPGVGERAVPVLVRLRASGTTDPPLHLPEPPVPVQTLHRADVRVRAEEGVVHKGGHPGRPRGKAGEAGVEGGEEEGRGDEAERGEQGGACEEDQGAARWARSAGKADARPYADRHREHERQVGEGDRGEGQTARKFVPAGSAGGAAPVYEAVRVGGWEAGPEGVGGARGGDLQ